MTQLLPRRSLTITCVHLGGVPRNPATTTWHRAARGLDRAWKVQVETLKYLWCHNRPSLVSTDLSCRDGIQATVELAIFARPSDVSQEDRGSSQELAEICQGQRIIRTKKEQGKCSHYMFTQAGMRIPSKPQVELENAR